MGGPGKFDLLNGTTRANTSAAFGLPTLLPNVNTSDTETKPVVSPDGLQLYFSSAGRAPERATTSMSPHA